MATARARWGLDRFEAPDDDSDPFDVDVEKVGTPIDLVRHKQEAEKLGKELVALVREEAELGVTCPIKDMDGTSCLSCPVRMEAPPFPLSRLCAIGVEQERLTTVMAARYAKANGWDAHAAG